MSLSEKRGPLIVRRTIAVWLLGISALFMLLFGTKLWESIDAHEILVVQSPVKGQLTWFTTPGIHWQGFGRVTIFPKVMTYEFQDTVRFNEGGHAAVIGSIQFRLPMDSANLTSIYTTYGSADAFKTGLLETVTDKSIFMTGPLLSSTESYAEKRSNLIYWIEDQIKEGVYHTVRRDVKTRDPITGEEKTVSVADISMTKDGHPERQESSQLNTFGVIPFNFAVARMPYDEKVEAQIQQQQQNVMAVQIAAAQARKAEQDALTAEQTGRANAATEKWKQEAIKAQAVTEAQQKLEVAALDAKAAQQEKAANIARGEGEAARRRLVFQADNALEKKGQIYIEVQKVWADAIAKYQGSWVPSITMGNAMPGSGNGAINLIDLLTAKTARDLQFDLQVSRPKQEKE